MPYKGDKGDKNAARPPEGSLVETRCLIKGPKSAIVPFLGPRSGPKSRTGRVRLTKLDLCPVVGRSRLTVVANCRVCSGVFHLWIHHLWPQGAVPPGFNPLRRGWVYRPTPEAPQKGECRRGPRHFWNCLSRWASALRQDPP